MTKEEAINYCLKHRNEFLAEAYESGEDGLGQYECLISCLEEGRIDPEELVDYGMDFKE